MKIGFNSGVLRKCGKSLEDTITFTKMNGANAFELSFKTSHSLLEFNLTEELIELLNGFDHLSIHAPFDINEKPTYKEDEFTKRIISKLEELKNKLSIDGIVFHPTNIEDFEFLNKVDLPILVENMDIRKNSFKNIEDIRNIKEKYNFGFVLDIEHSFENDPSMELTKNLIEIMENRLKEIHISGAKQGADLDLKNNNHCLLVDSEYKETLVKSLDNIGDIPIILEGSVDEGGEEKIKDEINYVKDSLK